VLAEFPTNHVASKANVMTEQAVGLIPTEEGLVALPTKLGAHMVLEMMAPVVGMMHIYMEKDAVVHCGDVVTDVEVVIKTMVAHAERSM
jgi:hypothetical protein